MGFLGRFKRFFHRAPVKYVLLVSPAEDSQWERFMLEVALTEYAPDVRITDRTPLSGDGYPSIRTISNVVAKDDAHIRDLAANEFGKEFRELEESVHSFEVVNLRILLGVRAEGSKLLIVRGRAV
jgi:hypothetical protein